MVNNDLSNNENILVKVDQNNLIYIDPNSVIDKDGNIHPRGVYPENLVMYANLEADIVPRSILASTNDQNSLISIANGTLNFLSNQNGGDYDSTWTDTYTNTTPKFVKKENVPGTIFPYELADKYTTSDDSGQSFGIDSINVTIKGANSIPQVTISFIDVRGKTLFEGAENSPYNAFFHLPWPIFYLTLKGYYGKAIRYRLHLIKFSSRFNDSNGNFEVSTIFVGSTFAFLNDLSLKVIMNAAYMFPLDNLTDGTLNENTQNVSKNITKSTKGYQILKNVYSEYKKKNLVKQNFPVITLRELIIKSESLDKVLEREILYEKLHPDIFIGLQDFEKKITDFLTALRAWGRQNLLNSTAPAEKENGVDIDYYDLKGVTGKTTNEKILGADISGTLENLINNNNLALQNSSLFTDELVKAASAGKTGGGNFKKDKLLSKFAGKIGDYYRNKPNTDIFQVKFDVLVNDVYEISNVFVQERDKLVKNIEEEMNNIVKDKEKGFGFEPTIRNIFAIILANADVYIRLMKDVHKKAFDQSKNRKTLLNKLSKETKGEPAIYPWPEVKKDFDNQKNKVIAYPGEKDLISKLQSNNAILWPEVEFVESFIEIATNKVDPLSEKENTTSPVTSGYENDNNLGNSRLISTLGYVTNIIPYIDTAPSSFLYEIYERANYFTALDSFSNISLNELSNLEFENISNAIKEDNQIIKILKDLVVSESALYEMLKSFSPFERYPYYQDQLPTIPYIKNTLEYSHEITEYNVKNKKTTTTPIPGLTDNLDFYKPESYRANIYPYNSELYLSYLRINKMSVDYLNLNGVIRHRPEEGFLTSPLDSNAWVKKEPNQTHLFSNKLKINNTTTHILNTPYFHKQLLNDFEKTGDYGRYVGSAYLLLTSLPFLDLEDSIELSDELRPYERVNLTSLFKEIGSTHYVPYHLICKWGAIYHRYKKYILDGVDILDGFLNFDNKTTPVDGLEFFNNGETGSEYTGFTANGNTITYSGSKDVGMRPFYDAIFHQVINDYAHYNILSGNTSFSANVNNKTINPRIRKQSNNLNYWTTYVDNSKFDPTDTRLTILPCDGADNNINRTRQTQNLITGAQIITNTDNFENSIQNYFKIIWEDGYINDTLSGKKFPTYDEYIKTFSTGVTGNNLYAIDSNNKKIIDLIGVFSPKILEDFENIFLEFSSQKYSGSTFNQRFGNIKYNSFQSLLKEICSFNKQPADDTASIDVVINSFKKRQNDKLQEITNNILLSTNALKFTISNPKEIDYHLWHGFANVDDINTFTYDDYFNSQLTDKNKQLIKLYLGEDIDGLYQNFFIVNNVKLDENNIIQFRPLVQIYAGYVKNGGINTSDAFKNYLKENVFNYAENINKTSGSISRRRYFLTQLIRNFSKLEYSQTSITFNNIVSGYENDKLKIELYNYFKSFNDKWISGNSIGQRLLLEEFLFFDKANKDIGDSLFLNLSRIISLGKQNFDKTNLYSVISILIKDSGVDMRPMPAYINFYGNNANLKGRIKPSKNVANDLFGMFLDVDYQDSSPKIILQLVGNNSKHLDILNKKYKFADDGVNISSTTNNPIIITAPEFFNNVDISKSNRAVAFEVSFGDQNQSIFKGVTLDQTTLKNTTESFVVLENLARSESGAGAYNVDIGLFDYYRQASYTCDVTCMGNAMIQPTMFFYLKNIPMFKGSYLITEVTHQIKGNSFTTTFKGARIPNSALPDPKDSFISSYRVLFDKLRNDVIKKQNKSSTGSINESSTITSTDGKTYRVNIGQEAFGEDFEKIKVNKAGYTEFGVPYNGYDIVYKQVDTIQLVKYTYPGDIEREWLRARVFNYNGGEIVKELYEVMFIVSKLPNTKQVTWGEIGATTNNTNFFSTTFYVGDRQEISYQKMFSAKTTFINPKNFRNQKLVTVLPSITGSVGSRKITGPVDNGTIQNFGLGLSKSLMKSLGVENGDIVYFRME